MAGTGSAPGTPNATGTSEYSDIDPNLSEIYRKKVERLTEAIKNPEDRNEAVEAFRALFVRQILAASDAQFRRCCSAAAASGPD
jgi:translation initiation factor IF-2